MSDGFLQFVLEQLAGLGRVRSRRLFSGYGLYQDEAFFGILWRDTLYLKVDDSNRADYEALGLQPFRPSPDRPEFTMSYYAVPAHAIDDAEELVAWARKSVAIGWAVLREKEARAAKRAAAKAAKAGKAAAVRKAPRIKTVRRRPAVRARPK